MLNPTTVALAGLNQQLNQFDRAAASVVRATAFGASEDKVELSSAVREVEPSEGGGGADLPNALVDLRVSKYLAVANLKVLKTADEVEQESLKLIR